MRGFVGEPGVGLFEPVGLDGLADGNTDVDRAVDVGATDTDEDAAAVVEASLDVYAAGPEGKAEEATGPAVAGIE